MGISTSTTAAPNPELLPPNAEWIEGTLGIPSSQSEGLASFFQGRKLTSAGLLHSEASFIKLNANMKLIAPKSLRGLDDIYLGRLYNWAHPPAQQGEKRPRLITERDTGFPLFALRISIATVNTIQDSDGDDLRFIALEGGVPWWNERAGNYPMYIRPFYDMVLDRLKTFMKADFGRFLLTGTPGTGKSLCGLYVVIKLYQEGALVHYQYKKDVEVLFVGSTSVGLVAKLGITAPGVYRDVEGFKDEILDISQCVHIWDPDENDVVDVKGKAFKFVVSSPNESKLIVITKSLGRAVCYMPLWTLEELQDCAFLMTQQGMTTLRKVEMVVDENGEETKEVMVKEIPLTVELVSARFDKFGGTARPVFNLSFDEELEKALSSRYARFSDIKALFVSNAGDRGKGDLSYLIVHRIPTAPLYSKYTMEIASKYISGRLFDKLEEGEKQSLRQMVAAGKGANELGSFRGIVYERFAHQDIVQGMTCDVAAVGSYKNPIANPQFVAVTFPRLTLRRFRSQLTELQPPLALNEYAQPESKVYQSFDSILKVPRTLLANVPEAAPASGAERSAKRTRSSSSPSAILTGCMQMMVGKTHPIKGNGSDTAFDEAGASEADRIILLVTDNDDVHKPQSIVASRDKAYKIDHNAMHIPQYVVRLKLLSQ